MITENDMVGFEGGNQNENYEAKVMTSCRTLLGDIDKVGERSQYKRASEGGREFIGKPAPETPENPKGIEKMFEIKKVLPGDDDLIRQMFELQNKRIDEDERDTLPTFTNSVNENLDAYHVILKDGNVVAFSCAGLYDVRDPSAKDFDAAVQPKQSILYMGYIVTDEEYESRGLSRELYQNAFFDAAQKAQREKSVIRGVISETVADREGAINRMDRKRMYYFDNDGNVQEVKYQVASHDRDTETGEKVAPDVAEHLMYRPLDGKNEVSVQDALAFVKTVYADNYLLPDMNTPEAVAKNESDVQALLAQLQKELSHAQGGKVFLWTKGEREAFQKGADLHGRRVTENITPADQKRIDAQA